MIATSRPYSTNQCNCFAVPSGEEIAAINGIAVAEMSAEDTWAYLGQGWTVYGIGTP